MTGITITPGVPGQIADLFETGEIRWEKGWGDRKTHTCLHGALLRPCAEPGDEIMWSILLSARGRTTRWNDEQADVSSVVAALRAEADPDEDEMVRVFGPNWRAARTVCRTWAQSTGEQREALSAASGRTSASDVWAAWDAWAAWAAWAVWAAWDAWDAWAAFVAVVAKPWINPTTLWTQELYDHLIAPWTTMFGEPS